MHIVQRGNDRQNCFLITGDYRRYLRFLEIAANRYEASIHAYVLMTNHVHLLITPRFEYSASRMMQYLGNCYVRTFNRIHGRTGTLWEGRFDSFHITTERYLFGVYRYIELNPVRAGMVSSPDAYRWSSYGANAHGETNTLIQPRTELLSLGQTEDERLSGYRRLFEKEMDKAMLADIRASIRSGSEDGSDPSSEPELD